MKKMLAILIALLLLISVAGCGGKTETPTDESKKPETAEKQEEKPQENPPAEEEKPAESVPQTEEPAKEDETPAEQPTGYSFHGYTETADWPDEEMWNSFGLPALGMTDDVNGSVHISDKDWIYPLNGKDGILIEANPASSQIDSIVAAIKAAGINIEEDQSFNKGYTAYYDYEGTEMKVTVSETEMGKLAVLIVTAPTD